MIINWQIQLSQLVNIIIQLCHMEYINYKELVSFGLLLL